MRSNLPYSLTVWATFAASALLFPACAKSIIGEGDGDGGISSPTADGSATTQPSDDAGSTVTNPTPGDDAGNNTTPPASGDDAGAPSSGDDAGTTPPPVADSAPPVSVPDSATPPPPTQTNCPDTSKYQEEYILVSAFGGTSCNYDSDCTSSQCCYDGSLAAGQGLCLTQ